MTPIALTPRGFAGPAAWDYGKGAVGGAASGAVTGTAINVGWGTLIGAGVGAAAGIYATYAGGKSADAQAGASANYAAAAQQYAALETMRQQQQGAGAPAWLLPVGIVAGVAVLGLAVYAFTEPSAPRKG